MTLSGPGLSVAVTPGCRAPGGGGAVGLSGYAVTGSGNGCVAAGPRSPRQADKAVTRMSRGTRDTMRRQRSLEVL